MANAALAPTTKFDFERPIKETTTRRTTVDSFSPLSIRFGKANASIRQVSGTEHSQRHFFVDAEGGPSRVATDPFAVFASAKYSERETVFGGFESSTPLEVTPTAERYAKSHGLYGSVLRTIQLVREIVQPLTGLRVDLRQDPEEGFRNLCFTIMIDNTIDHAIELDDALQDSMFDVIPARHRQHLSFEYKFS